MNIEIYDHDDYNITSADLAPVGTTIPRLRIIRFTHPTRAWVIGLHLTQARATRLRAELDRLFPVSELLVPEPERDAAPTEGGVVATQAQRDADYEAFATAVTAMAATL